MGILELHLHDPRFNFAPSVGGEGPSDSGVGVDFETESESGGRGAAATMVGIAVLVGVALAARRLMRNRREVTEYEQPPTP
jgi:hypothetical protein